MSLVNICHLTWLQILSFKTRSFRCSIPANFKYMMGLLTLVPLLSMTSLGLISFPYTLRPAPPISSTPPSPASGNCQTLCVCSLCRRVFFHSFICFAFFYL